MAQTPAPTFEQAVDSLESLIERVESGEIGLEEALKHYEQGAKLIQRCRKILNTAEKKIARLTETPGGELAVGGGLDDE